jgi:regulatory protein
LRNADLNDKELTKARNAAYRLLTYRPRSRAELTQKLQDRQFPVAVIEAVLEDLVRFGYVNDRQFAEQFASSRIRLRGFGRRRIEVELRNKGIDRQIIDEALAGVLDIDAEIDTAKKAAERKLNTMKAVDREAKYRRLAGFLERRGFSYDVIRIVLRNTE